MKKMMVLIGNYGSGKSELALNFAFQAAARGERTELLDLDMVNTYFRLTERGKQVEMKEIRLVSPNFANSGIETLSLPAEVASAFAMDWDTVIFDVGGDAVGSTALGRYHEDFMALEPGALEVLNVVNIRRPLAGTVERIMHLQEEMQIHSRLKITGMINNTNLAEVTGPDELRDGYAMIREVFPEGRTRPEVYRHPASHRHLHAARLEQLDRKPAREAAAAAGVPVKRAETVCKTAGEPFTKIPTTRMKINSEKRGRIHGKGHSYHQRADLQGLRAVRTGMSQECA